MLSINYFCAAICYVEFLLSSLYTILSLLIPSPYCGNTSEYFAKCSCFVSNMLGFICFHHFFFFLFLVGMESFQSKDVAPTSNANMQMKGSHFKHKMRKRHGYVFADFFYIILLSGFSGFLDCLMASHKLYSQWLGYDSH